MPTNASLDPSQLPEFIPMYKSCLYLHYVGYIAYII